MESWIPVTIAAAFFQNLRSAIQKHLTGVLSGQGAAYSRFLFALPWALAYLLALLTFIDAPLPALSTQFFVYCFAGSVTQIIATVCLLRTFSYRSFAVGTTFSKLEIVIVAVLGFVLLGDSLSTLAQLGVFFSTLGLFALSAGQNKLAAKQLLKNLASPATLFGLGAALFLGGSVIFFRGAALALESESLLISAAYTLAIALTIQTTVMGAYLLYAEPGQLTRVVASWRWSSLVGIAGMLASVGWFTAFTLQNASYVRALGQLELVFTFVASTRIFSEKVSALEFAGCALIITGIVVLLLN